MNKLYRALIVGAIVLITLQQRGVSQETAFQELSEDLKSRAYDEYVLTNTLFCQSGFMQVQPSWNGFLKIRLSHYRDVERLAGCHCP